MRNLENYGVQEISESSGKLVQGGSWLGKAVGKFVGVILRYAGPNGPTQIQIDMAISGAQKW